MTTIKANNLACPIDAKKLQQTDRQLVCENGHCFDIARQAYVNLLPVQHKRSKHPGDSKAMVIARTQFLDTGIYQPIAKKLNAMISACIISDKDTVHKNTCILDAGCGEGYYLDQLYHHLNDENKNHTLNFIGLDISKQAIIHATKRNRQISWLVGSNRQPPVAEQSVGVIFCLFGFLCAEPFHQRLKPGGYLITVDPGTQHLKELRAIIYTDNKKAEPATNDDIINGFLLCNKEELTFNADIADNEQINNLLMMTPHFFRASKAGREAACQLQQLRLTISVVFRVYRKEPVEYEPD